MNVPESIAAPALPRGVHAAATSSPWLVLAICSSAVFMASLDGTVLFVAFQDIARTYPAAAPADLSWVLNAYTIAYGALLVPAGTLADRFGRKRFFLGGVLTFVLASVGCALAPNVLSLIAVRALQAAGAAAFLPASLALVLEGFPPDRRGPAIGLWGAVGGLAAAIGPSVGALVVSRWGWPWVFYLNVPFGAAVWAFSSRLPRAVRSSVPLGMPDPLGIALLIASVASAAYALVGLGELGARDLRIGAATLLSLVTLAGFVLRSRRVQTPALDLSLFADRTFRFASLATLVFGCAFVLMFFGNIFFLTKQWHYTLPEAGLAITPGPLSVIPVAIMAGRLADRHGHRTLLTSGSALLAAVALVSVWLVDAPPDFWFHWLPRSLASGAAVGLIMPSLSGASVASLPRAQLAVGSAINQALRQFGGVAGVALAVGILVGGPASAQSHAFSLAYGLLALGAILTGAFSAALPKSRA